jgi:hypothetical protein
VPNEKPDSFQCGPFEVARNPDVRQFVEKLNRLREAVDACRVQLQRAGLDDLQALEPDAKEAPRKKAEEAPAPKAAAPAAPKRFGSGSRVQPVSVATVQQRDMAATLGAHRG